MNQKLHILCICVHPLSVHSSTSLHTYCTLLYVSPEGTKCSRIASSYVSAQHINILMTKPLRYTYMLYGHKGKAVVLLFLVFPPQEILPQVTQLRLLSNPQLVSRWLTAHLAPPLLTHQLAFLFLSPHNIEDRSRLQRWSGL